MIVATRRNHSVLNGCCTAMWKNYHIIIIIFPGYTFQKERKMWDASSGYKTYIQVFTKFHPFFGKNDFVITWPPEAISGSSSEKSDSSPHCTPTLPRPILIHFLYIHIYESQEAPSFQIFSSKFCMKVPSLSCVLLSQPISYGFAETPVHVGSSTKQLIVWLVLFRVLQPSLLSTIPQIPYIGNWPITETTTTTTTYPSTTWLSKKKKKTLSFTRIHLP